MQASWKLILEISVSLTTFLSLIPTTPSEFKPLIERTNIFCMYCQIPCLHIGSSLGQFSHLTTPFHVSFLLDEQPLNTMHITIKVLLINPIGTWPPVRQKYVAGD